MGRLGGPDERADVHGLTPCWWDDPRVRLRSPYYLRAGDGLLARLSPPLSRPGFRDEDVVVVPGRRRPRKESGRRAVGRDSVGVTSGRIDRRENVVEAGVDALEIELQKKALVRRSRRRTGTGLRSLLVLNVVRLVFHGIVLTPNHSVVS